MGTHQDTSARPRSLLWRTHLDVLPVDAEVARRAGYLVVRSPSNPGHYWGNLLLFDAPPGAGDGRRWESLFASEFAADGQVRHRTFAWDDTTGALGRAREELLPAGYELERTVALVAAAGELRPHARANRDVEVLALDGGDGDRDLWKQVVELQVAGRDPGFPEDPYRAFCRRRLADLRVLFSAGRGAWWVALDPTRREVLASCGIVCTEQRARFQTVDTAAAHRRRGICSRLLVEAAARTAGRHGTREFVIGADPDYHALGIYESLGFRPAEHVTGACLTPPPER